MSLLRMGAREYELTTRGVAIELGLSYASVLRLDGILEPRIESGGLYRIHRYYLRSRVVEYKSARDRALRDLRGQRA